jgi:glycosyltransferase involved in cell wall biosynthesis
MNIPSVTILLPVHNGENYLAQSVASVFKQDLQDFELHILDDDSSDGSASIAQSTGDPRVRYSRNSSRFGLFKTLNRGIEEARTELIRIWSHDDIMLPGSLRMFVEFAATHPSVGMMYSDFFSIDADGKRTGKELLYRNQRVRTPEVAKPQFSALLFWFYGCLPGNISTVMLRRAAWENVGRFSTGYQQAPDYDMWVRVSEFYDIGFICEKTTELREHSLQLGRVGQKEMTTIEEELPVLDQLQKRLTGVLSRKELRRGWVVERGRQHVHWIVKALLRGDFEATTRGWKAIKAYGQPWSQVLFWLVSMNGRLFVLDRDKLFDMKATCLPA